MSSVRAPRQSPVWIAALSARTSYGFLSPYSSISWTDQYASPDRCLRSSFQNSALSFSAVRSVVVSARSRLVKRIRSFPVSVSIICLLVSSPMAAISAIIWSHSFVGSSSSGVGRAREDAADRGVADRALQPQHARRVEPPAQRRGGGLDRGQLRRRLGGLLLLGTGLRYLSLVHGLARDHLPAARATQEWHPPRSFCTAHEEGPMVGLVRRSVLIGLVAAGVLAAPAAASGHRGHHDRGLDKIRHFVVVYEENHSFDNLYGGWEGVDGLRSADPRTPARSTRQARPTTACSRTTST